MYSLTKTTHDHLLRVVNHLKQSISELQVCRVLMSQDNNPNLPIVHSMFLRNSDSYLECRIKELDSLVSQIESQIEMSEAISPPTP